MSSSPYRTPLWLPVTSDRANLGEAVPDVMTPATWSLFQRFIYGAMRANFTAGFSPVGIIGGRLYMNLSLTAIQSAAMFIPRKKLVGLLEQAFGRIPDDVEIPRIPVSRWRVLRGLIPAAVRLQVRVRHNLPRFDVFLRTAPDRVHATLRHVDAASSPAELRRVWYAELGPLLDEASAMLETATRRDSGALLRTRGKIGKLTGEADADLLLTAAGAGGQLASLEPLLGLEQVAHGELSPAAYARQYGHRGPHEFEVSIPRPAEDVFFLTIDELLRVLGGDPAPLGTTARRKATHARCAALPAYPGLIRGAFDPFAWAATAAPSPPTGSDVLVGFAGAPGTVEGAARVLQTPEAAEALQSGEILVTTVTNVGWTPVFPRAAAIVTDIGAPLSHAAIVARELGIPAVVGTSTATQRIQTGDRLRVDGGRGTVEILSS
jgi:phosphohistidine swiveling domain-containing protein